MRKLHRCPRRTEQKNNAHAMQLTPDKPEDQLAMDTSKGRTVRQQCCCLRSLLRSLASCLQPRRSICDPVTLRPIRMQCHNDGQPNVEAVAPFRILCDGAADLISGPSSFSLTSDATFLLLLIPHPVADQHGGDVAACSAPTEPAG